MNENEPPTFPTDDENQRLSDQASAPNFQQPTTSQAPPPDQSNMEFAPMPAQHFGHYGSTFDMRHMSTALPDYTYRHHPHLYQSQMSQASNVDPQLVYSSFSAQQFAGQFANQFSSQYPLQINPHQRPYSTFSGNLSGTPSEHSHLQQPMYTLQHHTIHHPAMSQQPPYLNFLNQPVGQYGQVSPYQSRGGMSYQMPRLQVENPQMNLATRRYGQGNPVIRRTSSNSSLNTSATLRGPPRKPKQSGHALWVGNLPPGTQIMELKDHFSRDATDDIESVFLISKSNCAFVNYKTEDSCTAAMTRFHDSRFRGVRLVCRLRRGSAGASSPASAFTQIDTTKTLTSSDADEEAISTTPTVSEVTETLAASTLSDLTDTVVKEKFFIVKSLTVEDLERSVSSGIWATQAHNEESLNHAFKTAENVYLIFSANKSGEYFGYARMDSAIDPDGVVTKETETPQQQPAQIVPTTTHPAAVELPLTIPTPATATAPRGRIIDDSARGTIFWEAESALLTPTSGGGAEPLSGDSGETSGEETAASAGVVQQTTFGKPFKIIWQSTERLPFYRTRGLRNPWNANREVKIARDGTEIEPSVGRKLIGMFEQQAQINAASRGAITPSQYGYPHQQMPQYPPSGMNMNPGPGPYGYGMQGGPGPAYGRPY